MWSTVENLPLTLIVMAILLSIVSSVYITLDIVLEIHGDIMHCTLVGPGRAVNA